jgi:hypothetical protein
MHSPVRFKDSRSEQLIIDENLKLEKFIAENNFKKLENHQYLLYLDRSSYYTNDKNEVYRISKSGTILDSPILN